MQRSEEEICGKPVPCLLFQSLIMSRLGLQRFLSRSVLGCLIILVRILKSITIAKSSCTSCLFDLLNLALNHCLEVGLKFGLGEKVILLAREVTVLQSLFQYRIVSLRFLRKRIEVDFEIALSKLLFVKLG